MTKEEAEAIIKKKQEEASEYLKMRLYRAERHATKTLARITGKTSGISIYDLGSFFDPIPGEAGVNWSACGTQDSATTTAFAQALAECAKIAEDYNTERKELLEDLEAEANMLRTRTGSDGKNSKSNSED